MPASLARQPLAHLPTPVEPLPRLSAALGIDLWVKRDDLTGLAFGGNKTRKLELLLGEALAQGADTLITAGAAQSNHCRQTAAAAARLGLGCRLVLAGDPPPAPRGNLLLDLLLGAELIWAPRAERQAALEQVAARARAAGLRPYVIPYGGSSPTGAAAYARALRELLDQQPAFDRVVFATSSGGTQAGLAAGARLEGFAGRLTGISVDQPAPALSARVAELAAATAALLGRPEAFAAGDIEVQDAYLGGGYGVVGALEREALQQFARQEGLLLDPVYTARAAGGMLDLVRRGRITPGDRVLFWHTGGTPALFAYESDLLPDAGA